MSTDDSTSAAIRLARGERAHLTPVIGAGMSLPLGLPSWKKLVEHLLFSGGLDLEESTPAPEALREIKAHLGEPNFVARVQQALRVSKYVTSKGLQALVNTRVSRIITTNLDDAIETAFLKAGTPLRLIGRGPALEELSMFDYPSNEVVLLKIHGSFERPSTWVLTADDYDRAYLDPGSLAKFFVNRIQTPLFIGFSFSDLDIGQGLRLARTRWNHRAYAVIPADTVAHLRALLKSYGVIPIPFYSFDHIPEIIDEIFECRPLGISWTTRDTMVNLTVGGAEIEVPSGVVAFTTRDEVLRNPLVATIANALEVQPNSSLIDDIPRRRHSPLGSYRASVLEMVVKNQEPALELVASALSQYPETLLSDLVSWMMEKGHKGDTALGDEDYFLFFRKIYEVIPTGEVELLARLDSILLGSVQRGDLDYSCRRAISKTLARRKVHPALKLPPVSVVSGKLLVPIYPLTEHQVASLRGEQHLDKRSIRPYILRSIEESGEIIDKLSAGRSPG